MGFSWLLQVFPLLFKACCSDFCISTVFRLFLMFFVSDGKTSSYSDFGQHSFSSSFHRFRLMRDLFLDLSDFAVQNTGEARLTFELHSTRQSPGISDVYILNKRDWPNLNATNAAFKFTFAFTVTFHVSRLKLPWNFKMFLKSFCSQEVCLDSPNASRLATATLMNVRK